MVICFLSLCSGRYLHTDMYMLDVLYGSTIWPKCRKRDFLSAFLCLTPNFDFTATFTTEIRQNRLYAESAFHLEKWNRLHPTIHPTICSSIQVNWKCLPSGLSVALLFLCLVIYLLSGGGTADRTDLDRTGPGRVYSVCSCSGKKVNQDVFLLKRRRRQLVFLERLSAPRSAGIFLNINCSLSMLLSCGVY